jgi:hypothetical protein
LSRDPAILFYTSDFLTGTSRFTDEQCGQYIRALCSQHQEGYFTKEELFAILKSYDSPVWKKFLQDSDGLFFNDRMRLEIEKRISFCESRSHKGKSGRKIKSHDNHTIPVRESIGNHGGNGNDNDNGIDNILRVEKEVEEKREEMITDECFSRFWKAYPRKTGKGAAEKSWGKLKHPTATTELILKALEWQRKSPQWTKDNGQFIPMPVTYLNQRRWEDEAPRKAELNQVYKPIKKEDPQTPQEKVEAEAAMAEIKRLASGIGRKI